MKIGTIIATVIFCGAAAFAQQPYAGMEARAIKALSEQQVADLKAGRGMGLALAAELNGYPGPIHAIELADKLGLSSDQVARLRELFEAMKAETIPLGMQLIAAERSLDDAFAGRTITLASLESETQSIGAIQARLRAAHLKYHLAAVAVLTPEQVEKYKELRGYTGGAPQHPHMHQQGR
jgi:Spy/CpxP family protein refolding chaperone